MNNPVLEAENISFTYDGKHQVFKNVSFSLSSGDMFFILGANGCGKTTMLNCMSNTLRPTGGRILVSGTPVSCLSHRDISRNIAYVPQIQQDSCAFLVKDYVVLGRAPHLNLMQMPSEQDYSIAWGVMKKLGISHLAMKTYSKTSGGERQLAQLARAMVQESRLVLLDEPTNHLDYGNQQKILKLLSELTDEGYTVVLTTHMPDHPLMFNAKVGILYGENGFVFGAAGDLITEEILNSIYGIDVDLFYIDRIGRKACFCKNN